LLLFFIVGPCPPKADQGLFLNSKIMSNTNSSLSPSGFFEDNNGNKSSTRLKTFLSAITALFIALISIFLNEVSLGESLPVIITLLAFSSGEKSYQYFLESKFKKKHNE